MLRAAIALALVGAAVFTGITWPNTGRESLRADSPARGGAADAVVAPAEPERVPLTAENRDAALTTAQRFLETAVQRKNLPESWVLTHPDLRQGMTRAEWLTGDIPVVPFPVATARWKLDFSYRDSIGIQVLLAPRKGSGERAMAFAMELRTTADAPRRWLVSSWVPMGGTMAQRPPDMREGRRLAAGGVAAAREPHDGLIGVGWIFVPIGAIVGALLMLPMFLVGREWRARRRGERLHRDDVERRRRRGRVDA
jgi:hypothetical protein